MYMCATLVSRREPSIVEVHEMPGPFFFDFEVVRYSSGISGCLELPSVKIDGLPVFPS